MTKEVKTTEQNPYKVFDRADEDQVVEMIKGAVAKDMVYSFKMGGGEITGLSAAGTLAAVKAYNIQRKKKKLPPLVLDTKLNNTIVVSDGIICESTAVKGEESWTGSSYQPQKAKFGPDPFFSAKARTKAQRNAYRGLLPNSLMNKLIAKWTRQNKVKQFLSGKSNGQDNR